MSAPRLHDGWVVQESGPAEATHGVLLLPGGLCTGRFFDDLLAAPELSDTSIRFVATTVQGFGGTPAPTDVSVEGYAARAAKLAADLRCDAVVGHSFGANIALEMVAGDHFPGPVALLAPSLSAQDEARDSRWLDRIGRVPLLGWLAWVAGLRTIDRALRGSLPAHRHESLVAEMRRNDPGFCRRSLRAHFDYLHRHGSLVARLCASGAKSWVVFGEDDDVGLTDQERAGLLDCPHVTLITIPGAGHFTLNTHPGRIAEVVLDLISAVPGRPPL